MDAKQLVSTLVDVGIKAKVMRDGPDQDDLDVFMFEIVETPVSTGSIHVYLGNSTVRIAGRDKRHRQVVVHVDEPEHTVVRDISSSSVSGETDRSFRRRIRNGQYFPMRLPNGTTYKVIGDLRRPPAGTIDRRVAVTVEAHVPSFEHTFLMGIDEEYHFICALPDRVTSVREAHESLRPEEVPKGSPRHGEFFFVPATDEEIKTLESFVRRRDFASEFLDDRRGSPTTHEAKLSITTPKHRWFVRGYILDTRKPPRHKPLWLNDWCRPVSNLQLELEGHGDVYD